MCVCFLGGFLELEGGRMLLLSPKVHSTSFAATVAAAELCILHQEDPSSSHWLQVAVSSINTS